MRSIIIMTVIGFLLPANVHADVMISGHVQDETGAPISANIDVNGNKLTSEPNGVFFAQLGDEDIYKFSFSAEGFFPAVHTFSRYELTTAETEPNQIPPVTLVAKKQGRTLMIFGGDAMMGRRFSKPFEGEPALIRSDHKLNDAKAILKHVKPYLELADFASVNLETQVIETEPAEKAPKSVTFFTPPETIDALQWAGIDYVTLGNNHTYDYLDAGLKATLKHLRQCGIAFSGAGLTESEALRSYEAALDGSGYGMQGYVGWAGSARPSQVAEGDTKGGPPLGSFDTIIASVARDRSQGLLPIVQYHGSLEYGDEPSLDTETRLKGAIDAGAVMALGHHPHVYQGLEVYKGKLIAWSLGNFTFDQYFYTAQKSALLYVWMDGDNFHRAEVVPIYIKGYTPTPATGEMRHNILKRISSLSARRSTHMAASGGHAVVLSGAAATPAATSLDYDALRSESRDGTVWTLTHYPWNTQVSDLSNLPNGAKHRFGRDLLSRGDFEGYPTFDALDRSWLDIAANVEVTDDEAYSGSRSLKVTAPVKTSVETGMRKFTRAFKPGSPTTITAMLKSDKTATVIFSFQKRGTRDGLTAALEGNPKIELGRKVIQPGDWQQIAVDFISPRVGARSFRFLVEVRNMSGETTTVYLDDLALVEWQTPYRDETIPALKSVVNDFSHVQIRQ